MIAAAWIDDNQLGATTTTPLDRADDRADGGEAVSNPTDTDDVSPATGNLRSKVMQLRSAFNSPLDDAIAAFVAEVAEEQADNDDSIWQDEQLFQIIRGR